MNNLKNKIKELVIQQIEFKTQRKTSFTGSRTLRPSEAAYWHLQQRTKLRHYYIAYGFLKGKTIEQIESLKSKEYSVSLVEDIVKLYTVHEHVS